MVTLSDILLKLYEYTTQFAIFVEFVKYGHIISEFFNVPFINNIFVGRTDDEQLTSYMMV